MYIDKINQMINANNIKDALNLIELTGTEKDYNTTHYLLELLVTTDNHLVRNQVAIALSDLRCQEAVKPIVNLLKSPNTLGYRGTLLYALEPLDYTDQIGLLLDFIITGNFEVSRTAFLLLEQVKDKISSELKQEYRMKMETLIEELEDKIDFINEAIDGFTNI
ncbi:HEAT repeat domain-containing protein [Paenibacillus sp. GCM10023252]|uniref:HEAT repeat domain-containing protein n=1 Tax=Paenibacillus sp. GCM10023252 TaxID=3252649 RepID=UPI003607AE42